ncbi:MAG: hypothetical protein IPI14_10135 [Polaromonas sp.]|nr:hypothetical protein [Polaromonas sp.]
MCPEITLIVGKHEMYVDFHHRAVAAVERIAPVRQVMSIDEMECELTGSWRGREKAERIAMQIKQELQSTVGTCMRCSIGIAPNTMLGKLASDMQKPNGLTVLELLDIPGKILHLNPPPSAALVRASNAACRSPTSSPWPICTPRRAMCCTAFGVE